MIPVSHQLHGVRQLARERLSASSLMQHLHTIRRVCRGRPRQIHATLYRRRTASYYTGAVNSPALQLKRIRIGPPQAQRTSSQNYNCMHECAHAPSGSHGLLLMLDA